MDIAQGDSGIPVRQAIMNAITFRGIMVGSVKQYVLVPSH